MDILVVAIGGFIGANARYIIAVQFAKWFGTNFPYGTLFVNGTGSFVLSFFVTLLGKGILVEDVYRWLIAVGFCGGYTTFSTYTIETLKLLQMKQYTKAILANLVGSVALGLVAGISGIGLGALL
jgi:CrcB protein